MIPLLSAWKGASMTWKLISIIGPIVLVAGGYLAWKYHQQSIGEERIKRQVAEQRVAQKEEALGYFLVQEQQKQLHEYKVVRQKDRVHEQLRQNYHALLEQERLKEQSYDPATPICLVDPELVDRVNDLGRMLSDVSANGPPPAE